MAAYPAAPKGKRPIERAAISSPRPSFALAPRTALVATDACAAMELTYCVYILRSLMDGSKTYVGFTTRLEARLAEHNSGTQTYSRC